MMAGAQALLIVGVCQGSRYTRQYHTSPHWTRELLRTGECCGGQAGSAAGVVIKADRSIRADELTRLGTYSPGGEHCAGAGEIGGTVC